MESEKAKKLGTEPYKGVRDFYPEDMFVQNYIFGIMRKSVEQFGYAEYSASILEPTELYKAKSGEEIVNEQTYSFKDRGDRDVTLRPEMTPTITRMVAARKRELAFPLRWYSIPNLFRYEKPQRGRLREHFQLNVDLFGIDSIAAEIEMISVAHAIMTNFGAQASSFIVKINNRKMLNYLLEQIFNLNKKDAYSMMKLIDKKNKITAEEFKTGVEKLLADRADSCITLLNTKTIEDFIAAAAQQTSSEVLGAKETKELMDALKTLGITNAVFDPTLARGFDYYTGIVFEVNDTNPANPRALFGGGRFDDLLSVFGSDKVPAIGFGMGDVTTRDFLETYNLLPTYAPKTDIMLCVLDEKAIHFATSLAQDIRNQKINVAVDYSLRKVAQQIQGADKQAIPYILCIGENEMKEKKFTVKNLASKKEHACASVHELAKYIKNSISEQK